MINGDIIVLLRCVSTAVFTLAAVFLSGIEFDTGLLLTVFLYGCLHSRFIGYIFLSDIILSSVILRNSCCDTDSKKILESVNGLI